jgi:hypothetical protein
MKKINRKKKLLEKIRPYYNLVGKIELFIIFALVFVVGTNWVINNVTGVKNAIALATTVKPETFTELYFEDHINLPKTITKWQVYNFSFTVHNIEYQDMNYPYVVYVLMNNQKVILDSGNFTLKNDEFKTIKEDVGPFENYRAQVVVELTNKNQSIHFWVEQK